MNTRSTQLDRPAAAEPVFPVAWCREQFPALAVPINGREAVFLDGPAGSQVPRRVMQAITDYLTHTNANHGGRFITSRRSDAMLASAHAAVADLLGTSSPQSTIFGANMTTLTLAFSRALARRWRPGDEVIVTRLDHDANVTPWVLAAADAGATLHHVDVRPGDCTLDLDMLRGLLNKRTRLVAVGCASNAVGTINPVADICRWAHEAGAEVYLDAVHFAPHALLDVDAWGCDYLACSAYKFFGPHVGILWGRPELMSALPAYKVRPASDALPERWMTGTQNHEGIAGVLAAIEYLAELGRRCAGQAGCSRREALRAAFAAIERYEHRFCQQLLAGLAELTQVRVWGHRAERGPRVPTVAITHAALAPPHLADFLAAQGIFSWHGNFYALPLTEALDLEPAGLVRLGLLHYNTSDEVDRTLAALRALEPHEH